MGVKKSGVGEEGFLEGIAVAFLKQEEKEWCLLGKGN